MSEKSSFELLIRVIQETQKTLYVIAIIAFDDSRSRREMLIAEDTVYFKHRTQSP